MPAPPSLPLAPFPSPSAACIFSLQGSVALFQYPVPSGHLLQFVIILSIYLFWVSSPSGKPLSILLFVQGVLVSNLPFKQSEPEQRKINSELSLVQNLWLAGAWWELSPKEVARDACLAPGRPDSDILKQFSSLKYHCVDVISPAACCFSPRQDPGICLSWHTEGGCSFARNSVSESAGSRICAASSPGAGMLCWRSASPSSGDISHKSKRALSVEGRGGVRHCSGPLRTIYWAYMDLEGGRKESPGASWFCRELLMLDLRWLSALPCWSPIPVLVYSLCTDISNDWHSP